MSDAEMKTAANPPEAAAAGPSSQLAMSTQDGPQVSADPQQFFEQLPGPALNLVLQKLDTCSRACAAVTCNYLSHAVPAVITKVVLPHARDSVSPFCEDSVCSPKAAHSFDFWIQRHSMDDNALEQCSISSSSGHIMSCLPCPHLLQLRLEGTQVLLGPADGCPSVLQHCTGLTASDLKGCSVFDAAAAGCAAIAALPQLQALRLDVVNWPSSSSTPPGWPMLQLPVQLTQPHPGWQHLQLPDQLTHLSLGCAGRGKGAADLSQLSGLTNLAHLELDGLSDEHVPMPSTLRPELVELTHLQVRYIGGASMSTPFQHMSCLTALRQLSVEFYDLLMRPGFMSDIQHLSQLTGLQLKLQPEYADDTVTRLAFSTNSTSSWACVTALEQLSFMGSVLQPEALARFTQLQSLALYATVPWHDTNLEDLCAAVAQLTLLTHLHLEPGKGFEVSSAAAASFTSLTASTHLCSLVLRLSSDLSEHEWVMFRPGTVYPHLRDISLLFGYLIAPPQTQLQLLCSSCPALERLKFCLCDAMPDTLLPLQQLAALTQLAVWMHRTSTAVVVGCAVQLTGLKQLRLTVPSLADPALLQLTALTGLEEIFLEEEIYLDEELILMGYPVRGDLKFFVNTARWNHPPNVYQQLLKALQ